MKTPSEERFAYAMLARQGARLERVLSGGALPRLAEIARARGDLEVGLEFRLDDAGRPWVRGRAEERVETQCKRCLESIDFPLGVDFDLCIQREGATASDLAGEADVLVVEGETVSIAEIVEDELLLALPERLCREDPCDRAPSLSYPAGDPGVSTGAEARTSPFSILKKLKGADS